MASSPNPTGFDDTSLETDALSDAFQATSLGDTPRPAQNGAENPQADHNATRPLRIYTRAQLLNLHRSPLVQAPSDMPELKVWFGTENEQNLVKKDVEQSAPSGSRDRRFRRDYEEGEAPSRPSFRSTLTQPSQMGNFKHQSLRDRDKERDKDGDRDRERDLRDREGQERLRHLSDKYDRDRLSLTASARTKDRDSTTSTRTTTQAQLSSNASRRGEPRDSSKRKPNELGDDWRRGGDIPRSAREDRSDTTRRDRDRSRARDSSRTRPEASSRRERNADREEGRERSNRDREEPRRDRDDEEEGRHWRDDGKRDERVAAKKAKERGGDHWEPSSDRRWAATEERESRYKRGTGRDRRDDARDRDDRKEREKEKEPAWMETYVPSEPLAGILGGVASTGELDGIQAWKKGMKDKEREKDEKEGVSRSAHDASKAATHEKPAREETEAAQPMDEIQLFRLMMQKAKEIPDADGTAHSESTAVLPSMVPAAREFKRTDGAQTPGMPADSLRSAQISETKASIAQDTPSTATRLLTIETSTASVTSSEKSVSNSPSHFNPPAGPRLLALGRGSKQPSVQPPNAHLGLASPHIEAPRGPAGYNTFEDAAHQRALYERITPNGPPLLHDGLPRVPMDRSPLGHPQQFGQGILDHGQIDANGNGYAAPKGSRFAKFFDGKGREAPPVKVQTPTGFTSPSPNHGQGPRFEQGSFGGPLNGVGEQRAMDDIMAMLANSQAHRTAQNVNVNPGLASVQPNSNFTGHNNHPILHQHQLNSNRSEPLYDSRLDDRSFVPDGMVPGLRTAPLPRSRDNFPESVDDPILHLQRLAQHQQLQQRADPNFGAVNPMFAQPPQPRGMGHPLQGQPFRGGPSPNTAQQLGIPSRTMPPGLANLGSRPPHEASQFLGLPGGPTGPQLAALTNNGQHHQQQFTNYNNANSNTLGYGSHQQFRAPLPSLNAQNVGGHIPLGNLAQNNIDPRLAVQGFALGGLGGNVPVGQRVLPPHQRPGPQLQGPHLGGRSQQQGHLPPHVLPHNIHNQGPQGPTNQSAQDLMALLMGGGLRNE